VSGMHLTDETAAQRGFIGDRLTQVGVVLGIVDPRPEDALLRGHDEHDEVDMLPCAADGHRLQGPDAPLKSELYARVSRVHSEVTVWCAQNRAPVRPIHHRKVPPVVRRELRDCLVERFRRRRPRGELRTHLVREAVQADVITKPPAHVRQPAASKEPLHLGFDRFARVDVGRPSGEFIRRRPRWVQTAYERVGVEEVVSHEYGGDHQLGTERQCVRQHSLVLSRAVAAVRHAVHGRAGRPGQDRGPGVFARHADSVRVGVADGHDVGMRQRCPVAKAARVVIGMPGVPPNTQDRVFEPERYGLKSRAQSGGEQQVEAELRAEQRSREDQQLCPERFAPVTSAGFNDHRPPESGRRFRQINQNRDLIEIYSAI